MKLAQRKKPSSLNLHINSTPIIFKTEYFQIICNETYPDSLSKDSTCNTVSLSLEETQILDDVTVIKP